MADSGVKDKLKELDGEVTSRTHTKVNEIVLFFP